jgi:hypothetical protein
MKKETIFQILAVGFLLTSAYFYRDAKNDYAFFFLVLSACSFLLNIRSQAKARISANEAANLHETPTDN